MNELEQNYLEHHGILGQKWGVRRYQNPDGSLTDAGRKRYGIGEKEAKDLLELEANDPQKFHDVLNKNKAVRKFYSKSPERKELTKALISDIRRSAEMNMEANKRARKAVGGKEFSQLMAAGDAEGIAKYMEAGKKYAQSEEVINEYKKSKERLDKAQRAYEKKGREFVDDLLGEYGKMESKNPMSISYNIKTGKISQQTLADRAAYELYRGAGGQPRKR